MTPLDHHTECAWVCDRIDAHLDGCLSPEDALALERHLTDCAACAKEMELARQVAGTLRALPVAECPEYVVASVYAGIRAPEHRSAIPRSLPWLPLRLSAGWRPVLAGLAAVVLVVVTAIVGNHPPAPTRYSAEDIARAQAEVQLALGLAGRIGRDSQEAISREIIGVRVILPIHRALERSRIRYETSPNQEAGNAG